MAISKKTSILICIIVFMFVFNISSYADTTANIPKENSIITPMWTNTDLIDIDLSFSGLKANCYIDIIGKTGVTKITATAILQKKNSNGTFTNIKTWSNLSAVGSELIFSEYYYVTNGYTYRLTVNTNVYKGSGYESITAYDESYCT